MGDPLEEADGYALDAEQLRELRRCDVDRRAGLEAGDDRVRQEVRHVRQAEIPPPDSDQSNQQRDARAERNDPGRIAAAQRGDAGGDRDCQGRCRADRELSAGAEQGVGDPRHQVAVEARDRRKIRERGVGKRLGDGKGRERQAGDDVRSYAPTAVTPHPLRQHIHEHQNFCAMYFRAAMGEWSSYFFLVDRSGSLTLSCSIRL